MCVPLCVCPAGFPACSGAAGGALSVSHGMCAAYTAVYFIAPRHACMYGIHHQQQQTGLKAATNRSSAQQLLAGTAVAKVVGPNRLTSSGCSLGTEPSRARDEASTRSCLLSLQLCTPAGPATYCLRQQRTLLLPGCLLLLLLLLASCMASNS